MPRNISDKFNFNQLNIPCACIYCFLYICMNCICPSGEKDCNGEINVLCLNVQVFFLMFTSQKNYH